MYLLLLFTQSIEPTRARRGTPRCTLFEFLKIFPLTAPQRLPKPTNSLQRTCLTQHSIRRNGKTLRSFCSILVSGNRPAPAARASQMLAAAHSTNAPDELLYLAPAGSSLDAQRQDTPGGTRARRCVRAGWWCLGLHPRFTPPCPAHPRGVSTSQATHPSVTQDTTDAAVQRLQRGPFPASPLSKTFW